MNLGVDIRVLQLEDAKDPDEYVVKHGNAKFGMAVAEAISLVEFKVKMFKGNLNLEIINDKIKFLNEIAKLLSSVDNKIEQEVYIDKIAKEYGISKESIYAEVNKLNYANNKGSKVLQKRVGARIAHVRTSNISKAIVEREELVLALLMNHPKETYEKLKDKIKSEDFQVEENKEIMGKLYEELKTGNSNVSDIVNYFSENENILGILTKVASVNYGITDVSKATSDILNIYAKEKLTQRRSEILKQLAEENIDAEVEKQLLEELNEITKKQAQK